MRVLKTKEDIGLTENEARELWENARNYLSSHQVVISETIFQKAGSHKICWICGDDEDLYLLTVETNEGTCINAIMCEDCMTIQASMGLKIIDAKKIK